VLHARAAGRGKSAEADADWGEGIASNVLAREKMMLQSPRNHQAKDDRLKQAHLLGLPICLNAKVRGSLVFVRFGGPAFEKEHIALAKLAGNWVTFIIERKQAQEIQASLDSLQQRVRLQDDFLATISHELRTPLGFIKGYSTTLLRPDTTWDDETSREFLSIIDEETDRLSHLIDNILQSAKLQSKAIELDFQPIRIEALIRDVMLRAKNHHKSLNFELDFSPLPPIWGDSVLLTQVFENLVSNTLKYAANKKVFITVKKEDDVTLLVEFADQGEGIAEEYLPYIFQRFYRVPGKHMSTGSGLGLYICNQIIVGHHGKIWVESEVNKGTTFFIRLPINQTR
jgi:signal transduction histidine kinase